MTGLDLVVFDVAGTTLRTGDHVPAALKGALNAAGVELSDAEIQSMRGRSKREAIADLLSRRLGDSQSRRVIAKALEDFRRRLLNAYEESGVEAMEGAEDAFAWCRSHGVKIALTTGFDRETMELLLRSLQWRNSANVVVCDGEAGRGRPAPFMIFRAMELADCDSVRRVANVGDTRFDLQAGFNAGVGWNIGVLSGASSRAQLEDCPHTAIIDGVGDLPNALSQK